MKPTVLIVDDDRAFARAAGELAAAEGFDVFAAHTVQQAGELLKQRRMDLMLLDLHLPDGSGMDLLDEIDLAEHGQIAVVTGSPSIESAMRAVSAPVVDYLLKPLCPRQYKDILRKALKRAQRSAPSADALSIDGLVGTSPAMRGVIDTLHRIAPSDASVLVVGESGTGKEVVAKAIHELSGRKGAFVAINCGAVPSELLASQLFGHERGSFTGAHARHIGVFEQAAHGTLMLDEITEMPIALQVYLLRVLESGGVTRVGGIDMVATPVRVVAATNRDPHAAISAGTLREDLYYRLADISIDLPPLRQRGDDILQIAQLFVERLNARYGRRKFIAPSSEPMLLRHRWPGNVRELRSAIQRAYLLDSGDELHVSPAWSATPTYKESDTDIVFSIGMSLAELERQALLKTLAYYNNDKSAAARVLGVSVRTVHNHLARMETGEPSSSLPDVAA
jgi:DNA-binding NtrC family response regulator